MRNITLLTAVFVLGFTAPAIADPSSNVAFDAETRALLKSADPAKGKAIAEKRKCAKCHGDMGLVDDPEDVNLAGQVASYTFKQLRDYKDEKRDNRSMKRATKKLTQEDMAHLAVWFESLPATQNVCLSPALPAMAKMGRGVCMTLLSWQVLLVDTLLKR